MNRILKLTKVFLKTSVSQYKATSKTENKASRKALKTFGTVILVLYLAGVFGFLSYGMISLLNDAGQPAFFIGIALLGLALLVLIQTVLSSINLFYFSKDLEYILPLPFKPYEIVIAKFNTLMVTEYVTVLLFLLVPFIMYGVLTGASVLFYVNMVLVLLLFPILPALIATILVMLIMCISGVIKNKDRFQTIVSVLLIGLVLFVQMGNMEETTDDQMLTQLTQFNGLVSQIDDYFITLADSINALTNYNNVTGLISIVKLLLISAAAYAIFIFIAQKLYFKGAVGARYSGKAKKKKDNGSLTYKKQNVELTYVKKEFSALFKNPIFFTQCILPSILMPVIFTISAIAGFNSGNEAEMEGMETLQIVNSVGLCILIAINIFMCSMDFIPVTAISRDGQNASFMKYIPIELDKQCTYKIIPAVIMNVVSTIILDIIVLIMFKASLLFIILLSFISILLSIFFSYVMIIVDLKNPKLKWDSEYTVVKQNVNMLWGIALSVAMIILLVIGAITLSEIPYLFTAIGLILISILCIYLIKKYISKNQEKLFEKVQ